MILKSFRHAFDGVLRMGRNFCIMGICFILVVVLGFVFKISKTEWLAALICSGGVLALEMINTAIEKTVDLFTRQYSADAKKAKDIAAGAVLVFSIFSAVVAMIIFLPHIIDFLSR